MNESEKFLVRHAISYTLGWLKGSVRLGEPLDKVLADDICKSFINVNNDLYDKGREG